jgi:hypothetical protein
VRYDITGARQDLYKNSFEFKAVLAIRKKISCYIANGCLMLRNLQNDQGHQRSVLAEYITKDPHP